MYLPFSPAFPMTEINPSAVLASGSIDYASAFPERFSVNEKSFGPGDHLLQMFVCAKNCCPCHRQLRLLERAVHPNSQSSSLPSGTRRHLSPPKRSLLSLFQHPDLASHRVKEKKNSLECSAWPLSLPWQTVGTAVYREQLQNRRCLGLIRDCHVTPLCW